MACICTCAALGVAGLPAQAGALGAPAVKVLGWGFDQPAAMAVDGPHLFVANAGSSSVTELNVATMTRLKVYRASRYRFVAPRALVTYGPDLWALNSPTTTEDGSLSEVNLANGALVRVLKGPRYQMNVPTTMVIDGPDIFVLDAGKDQLSEIDARNGRLVRIIDAPEDIIAEPSALTTIGPDVFIANDMGGAGGTVTEIAAATGRLVQVISGVQCRFNEPVALSAYGPDLFVLNSSLPSSISASGTAQNSGGSITEIDTAPTASPASPPTPTSTTSTTATTTSTTASSTTATTATTTSTTTASTTTTATTATTGPPQGPAPAMFSVVRVISGKKYNLVGDRDEVVAGGSLFVASFASVTQVAAATGNLLRVQSDPRAAIQGPDAAVATGGRVILANLFDNVLTVLNASTGALQRTVSGSAYDFDGPSQLLVSGGHLFVLNETEGGFIFSGGGVGIPPVTEANASTGALVRVIGGPQVDLAAPISMALQGGRLYVADLLGGGITVVDVAHGSRVEAIPLAEDDLGLPTSVAVAGRYLLVGGSSGKVAELDASDGRLLRLVQGKAFHLGVVRAMAVAGPDVFVASASEQGPGSAVTEVNMATGDLVRVISATRYGLEQPSGLLVSGPDLFIVNLGPQTISASPTAPAVGSLTEVDVATGALVRVISGPRYAFSEPRAATIAGNDLYVPNPGDNSVTEINASNGSLVRVLQGPGYGFITPLGAAVWHRHLYISNAADDTVADVELPS